MQKNSFQFRLERLLKRLQEGAVIPFVGAGISLSARVPSPPFVPSIKYLEDRLCERLEAELATDGPDTLNNRMIRSFYNPVKDNPAKDEKPSLAWLSELGALLWGHAEVCQVLQIVQFAKLEPLSAHRYLAYLAREGLVTEIVSTNYDCCIEKAYRASFGDKAPEAIPLAVISTLSDYRANGGTLTIDGRPALRLYKINGCAQAYTDKMPLVPDKASDEQRREWREAAERIILTERQLQNFRNERWVEDLFRDRARSRNLLFCGFGSEEPQVRHTALSLVAEFQDSARQ